MKIHRRFAAASDFYYFIECMVLLTQINTLLLEGFHVRPPGLEPGTSRLKAACSTN